MGTYFAGDTAAIQGFAVGGEWGGAALLSVEVHRKIKKPFTVAVYKLATEWFTAFDRTGFIDQYDDDWRTFLSWGWRIPFLFSIVLVLGACGCVMAWRSPRNLNNSNIISGREKTHPGYRSTITTSRCFLKIIALRLCELLTMYIVTALHLIIQPRIWGYRANFSSILVAGRWIKLPDNSLFCLACRSFGRRRVYITGALIGTLSAFPSLWRLKHNLFSG